MTGTFINVTLILAGVLYYRLRKQEISAENQQAWRAVITFFVLFAGARLLWNGLSGGFIHGFGQLAIVFVSLSLGNVIGTLLGIQSVFNRIAVFAKAKMESPTENTPHQQAGFLVTTGLFCVTPLAILGPIIEGTSGDATPLIIKSMMDGIAIISFCKMFGYQVALTAVPVLAFQGTLTLLSKAAGQTLLTEAMREALTATSGCLVFTVILLVFGLQQVRLGNYLPSLIVAPLLARWWW